MKIDLKKYKGFALIETESKESLAIIHVCALQNIHFKVLNKKEKCPIDYVPSGSVEWCLNSLGKEIKPDYYPEWAQKYLYRKIWEENNWPLGKKVFIKPSDRYKRFTGFVTTGTYKKKKKPPFICSDIVYFENEWRYYISNGKVLCGEWYWGDERGTPCALELKIEIPSTYSGALDFGEFSNGTLALIESNHPFACGWYGKDHSLYVQWIVDGWEYMQEII